MDIRAEPHYTITIVLTDEEVKTIILDPDAFLSELQDVIAPNGDYSKRSAQTEASARRGQKRAYKGHRGKSLAPKRTCEICGRAIAAHWYDRHVANHQHPEAE